MYYHFQPLFKFHGQIFLLRVNMVNQSDKPLNLANFAFDEESHERKIMETVWTYM